MNGGQKRRVSTAKFVNLRERGRSYWILDIGYWILVIGYWILVIGYWILVIGYWGRGGIEL